jgi:DNA-binding SARP family transcriptional activator
LNNPPTIGHPLTALARLLVSRGDIGDAAIALTMLLEALELHAQSDDRWGIAWALEGLAGAAVLLSDPARAAKLMAAAETLRESISAPRPPGERQEAEQFVAASKRALDEKAFRVAWNEGSKLPLEAVIEFALQPGPAEEEEEAIPPKAAAPAITPTEPCALRVYALGPLRIARNDAELDVELWRSSKARELLLFLLCNPAGVTRDQVGLALWPDASSAQLRNSFHVTMHRLRKGLGEVAIEVNNDRYRFALPGQIEFDAQRFEREITLLLREQTLTNASAERLLAALALYRGDFLAGERVGDWHDALRERLCRLFRDGVRKLAEWQVHSERYRDAANSFERLIAADPLEEDAYRGLLLCYTRLGERGSAARAYQRLVRALREELDSEPEEATEALARRLQLVVDA